jgi:NADH:ubiquinone oxidoreductase subunit F (NADH-binding)
MDEVSLKGDPHSVIEGMIIADMLWCILKGFAYVRAEYPLAIARVQKSNDHI